MCAMATTNLMLLALYTMRLAIGKLILTGCLKYFVQATTMQVTNASTVAVILLTLTN